MTTQLPSKERLEEVVSYDLSEFDDNPGLREEWQFFARALLAAYEQEPVAVVELSDFVTAAQLSGEEPRKKAVKELYEGALIVGQNLYTHSAPSIPAVPGSAEILSAICDLFHIGAEARTKSAILTNIENTIHFADQLDAIEKEFFMVPGEPDEDYPDETPADECLVNRWGSTTERYVEQFREALLRITNPAPVPAVPDSYVLMPMKLTAENGAKYALSGEFHVLHRVTCNECGGEGCSDCDDDGWLEEKIMIGWDDIKDIYRAAVEACSIKSTCEGV